jgi:hypothetical protein
MKLFRLRLAKDLVPPMPEIDSHSDDDGEHAGKKNRTLRKNTRPWESVAMFEQGEGAVHDAVKVTDMTQLLLLKNGAHTINLVTLPRRISPSFSRLKLQQIEAIRAGVVIAPKQSAKLLRRNVMHASPDHQIQPELARSVERHVRKFRAKLTEQKLDGIVLDDSE